jgi:hypothetical protein
VSSNLAGRANLPIPFRPVPAGVPAAGQALGRWRREGETPTGVPVPRQARVSDPEEAATIGAYAKPIQPDGAGLPGQLRGAAPAGGGRAR